MRGDRVRPGRAVRWLVVALWMGVIFYVSAQPDLPHHPQAGTDVMLKKLAHMAEYGILASLVYWAWKRDDHSTHRGAALVALVVAGLYAVTDEIHQAFVPGRSPQLLDVAFDLMGASLALFIVARWSSSRQSPPAC